MIRSPLTDRPAAGQLDVAAEPAPVDPFEGFFRERQGWTPAAGGLLDIADARYWFSRMESVSGRGLYTFQQPMAGRSGASVVEIGGRPMLMMSSYDYLGLLGHPQIEAAAHEAIDKYGTGTGGVRLLTGTTELHRQLERDLAAFKRTEAALTFTSGYMATLGLISALLGPGDHIVVDEHAHRSIIDACKLAGVRWHRFRHNDVPSLRGRLRRIPRGARTLVVVEGVYSMDGDICPLPEVVELKDEFGVFLMVDEAHSFGVLGASGRGVDEHYGLAAERVDIWMGALSKAIPSNGGFIAGSRELIVYMQHAAAPFIFSAALCPAATGAAREALRVLAHEPERLTRQRDNAAYLRNALRELGYDTGQSATCIIPVLFGDEELAHRVACRLYGMGILASAVVHPAVPRGAARLRLCVTAGHTESQLDEVIEAFRVVRTEAAPSLLLNTI